MTNATADRLIGGFEELADEGGTYMIRFRPGVDVAAALPARIAAGLQPAVVLRTE